MKTIRQAAAELGISVQAVHDRLKVAGIEPKRDKLTNWRMLTDIQIKRLSANGKAKGATK